jgi:acetyltransferase-like isoleucine patch superfamily enzyme
MPEPLIRAGREEIGSGVQFGPNIEIEADELRIADGAVIGLNGSDDFRTNPGVRITARTVDIGPGVQIGSSVRIEGGAIEFGGGTRVDRNTTIRVLDHLRVGAHGAIGEGCEISGREISFGQELWMLPHVKIGGGSAFESSSRLQTGHYLHVGTQTLINTARAVTIGHEVGLGTRTSIYTHGAYPSGLMGFPVAFAPVQIGDFTWIPGAVVNPGVSIGRCCVVGVNSVVTRDLPDGCLAAGSPAKVLKESVYPAPLEGEARLRFFRDFLGAYRDLLGDSGASATERDGVVALELDSCLYAAADALDGEAVGPWADRARVIVVAASVAGDFDTPAEWTVFDLDRRRVRGQADDLATRFANELRRHGVRFYSRPAGGVYADWEPDPPRFGAPST